MSKIEDIELVERPSLKEQLKKAMQKREDEKNDTISINSDPSGYVSGGEQLEERQSVHYDSKPTFDNALETLEQKLNDSIRSKLNDLGLENDRDMLKNFISDAKQIIQSEVSRPEYANISNSSFKEMKKLQLITDGITPFVDRNIQQTFTKDSIPSQAIENFKTLLKDQLTLTRQFVQNQPLNVAEIEKKINETQKLTDKKYNEIMEAVLSKLTKSKSLILNLPQTFYPQFYDNLNTTLGVFNLDYLNANQEKIISTISGEMLFADSQYKQRTLNDENKALKLNETIVRACEKLSRDYNNRVTPEKTYEQLIAKHAFSSAAKDKLKLMIEKELGENAKALPEEQKQKKSEELIKYVRENLTLWSKVKRALGTGKLTIAQKDLTKISNVDRLKIKAKVTSTGQGI